MMEAASTPSDVDQRPWTVVCFMFDGFEMLDAFGPLEMFACLNRVLRARSGGEAVNGDRVIVRTAGFGCEAAASMGAIPCSGPRVACDINLGAGTAPMGLPRHIDILLVPGGLGTRTAVEDEQTLGALRELSSRATTRCVASVCTGSALLARAGVLDGLRATSNKLALAWAKAQGARVHWVDRARFVLDGKFATSSGVAAGIDLALALIERHFGADVAAEAARLAEYVPNMDPDNDPFAAAVQ